jgi:hypothetical protein
MTRPGSKGKYYTTHTPITDEQIRAHLIGAATYAVPLIGSDGLASAALVELDCNHLEGARRIQRAAAARNVVIAIRDARRQRPRRQPYAITSQGKLVSYSDHCDWAPHFKSGKCQDAFGLYCLVEHGGRVNDAIAALLPPKQEKSTTIDRHTPAQIEAHRKDAERKRTARRQAAANLQGEVLGRAAVDDAMPQQSHYWQRRGFGGIGCRLSRGHPRC